MFLQVVPLSRNVAYRAFPAGQLHTRHFTHGRVRFLRFGGVHLGADTLHLWARVEERGVFPSGFRFTGALERCGSAPSVRLFGICVLPTLLDRDLRDGRGGEGAGVLKGGSGRGCDGRCGCGRGQAGKRGREAAD